MTQKIELQTLIHGVCSFPLSLLGGSWGIKGSKISHCSSDKPSNRPANLFLHIVISYEKKF